MTDLPSTAEGTARIPVDGGREAVPGFAGAWAAAQAAAPYATGLLQDFLDTPADRQRVFQTDAGSVSRLALPFRREEATHNFAIGARLLGSMRARALRLANFWMAEGHPPEVTAGLLRQALRQDGADMLILGEIPETSDLRAALRQLSWPARALPRYRKTSQRWVIDLPDSFETYFKMLSKPNRKSLGKSMRRLEKEFAVGFEVICDPADVDHFLTEAEKVSRLTYQWNLGQRLENTEARRAQFRRMAEAGRLRCYLLSLDGTVRAFGFGSIEDGLYRYDTTGYDPAFAEHSVGSVILLYMLQDLIGTRACRGLDFGMGGDEASYKSRFGTRSVECNSWYVLRLDRPRGMAVLLGENILQGTKNLADRILPKGEFRAALKRRLRRYGG